METEIIQLFIEGGLAGVAVLTVGGLIFAVKKLVCIIKRQTMSFKEQGESFKRTIDNHIHEDLEAKYKMTESFNDQKRVIETFLETQKEMLRFLRNGNGKK